MSTRLRLHEVENAGERYRTDRLTNSALFLVQTRRMMGSSRNSWRLAALTFPIEHACRVEVLLKDGLNTFVDLAMARVRRRVSLEDHVA